MSKAVWLGVLTIIVSCDSSPSDKSGSESTAYHPLSWSGSTALKKGEPISFGDYVASCRRSVEETVVTCVNQYYSKTEAHISSTREEFLKSAKSSCSDNGNEKAVWNSQPCDIDVTLASCQPVKWASNSKIVSLSLVYEEWYLRLAHTQGMSRDEIFNEKFISSSEEQCDPILEKLGYPALRQLRR